MAATKLIKVKVPVTLFVLWRNKTKDGVKYLSGQTEDGKSLIGKFLGKKDNPNLPDARIYLRNHDGSEGKQYCSLWCRESQKGTKYLSGSLNDKDKTKIKGFFEKKDDPGLQYPDIRFYTDSELENPSGEYEKDVPAEESEDETPF